MALKLAVDFGTATTCMARVIDETTLRPEVVPIEDGKPFSRTAVFIDRSGAKPLIRSSSAVGRHPIAVFGDAYQQFNEYWALRRKARRNGIEWSQWQRDRREEAMLLTYFKPELSDESARVLLRVPRIVWGAWDALAQTQDLMIAFEERSLAAPDPETDDLVAATAAVLRSCVERALETAPAGERISHLALGIPSLTATKSPFEYDQGIQRRQAAVEIARIKEDFGTSDFEVCPFGEAQAAAWSIEIDSDEPTIYVVIVDVGAGTTDLALVEFVKEKRFGYTVKNRILTDSIRFAGRDINLALAQAFQLNDQFRKGIRVLDQVDRRAWQHLMFSQIEDIKCRLNDQPRDFAIDFSIASAAEFGTLEMSKIAHTLNTTAFFHGLSARTQWVKDSVRKTLASSWRPAIVGFLEKCMRHVGDKPHLLRVEKVGGAFRFLPLHAELVNILQEVGLPSTSVRYRDDNQSSQTAVARGLAKWVVRDVR